MLRFEFSFGSNQVFIDVYWGRKRHNKRPGNIVAAESDLLYVHNLDSHRASSMQV